MIRFVRNTPMLGLALSVLVLSACAQKQTRPDDTPAPPAAAGAPAPTAPATAPTPPAASPAPRVRSPASAPTEQAQFTGIAVCDEYLASYHACHRVIGAIDPALLDERLETLRATWQGRAGDPAQHEALTAQCQNLTDTMKDALDGRECASAETDFVQPGD